jgi:hypothetical protein
MKLLLGGSLIGLVQPKYFYTPLVSDEFSAFFKFYNALITVLNVAGYHSRLLPSLELLRSGVDLKHTPVEVACMPPVMGPVLVATLEWTLPAILDAEHLMLGNLLYTSTLSQEKNISPDAVIAQGILDRHCQGSDGFVVLQELLLLHHPRLVLSRAPSYDAAMQLRPTLGASEYHTTYLQRLER